MFIPTVAKVNKLNRDWIVAKCCGADLGAIWVNASSWSKPRTPIPWNQLMDRSLGSRFPATLYRELRDGNRHWDLSTNFEARPCDQFWKKGPLHAWSHAKSISPIGQCEGEIPLGRRKIRCLEGFSFEGDNFGESIQINLDVTLTIKDQLSLGLRDRKWNMNNIILNLLFRLPGRDRLCRRFKAISCMTRPFFWFQARLSAHCLANTTSRHWATAPRPWGHRRQTTSRRAGKLSASGGGAGNCRGRRCRLCAGANGRIDD